MEKTKTYNWRPKSVLRMLLLAVVMYSPILVNYIVNRTKGQLALIALGGLVIIYVVFRYWTKIIVTGSGIEHVAIVRIAKINWADVTYIRQFSTQSMFLMSIFKIFADHDGIYDLYSKEGRFRVNFNLFPIGLKQDVLKKLKEYGHLTTG